jgi:AcrR family transcriptional regulator
LDAAERLLREEGYAAVTSRRVGAEAGVKPQLVHYYWSSMDDLFIEIFRRRAEQNLARFEQALALDGSLRNLWKMNFDPRGAQFTIEFVALANHRKAIQGEIAKYAARFRAAQLEALRNALHAAGIAEDELPPTTILLLMTGLSQILAIEQGFGFSDGHAEVLAEIEAWLLSIGA